MYKNLRLIATVCIILLSVIFSSNSIVVAQESEIENEEQFSNDAEKLGYIHDVPPCPVIIDGVKYEPEQIHLFDGIRLRFSIDNQNRLYAFTTVSGIEQFLEEQRSQLKDEEITPKRAGYSFFYENAEYGGSVLAVPPGSPGGYIENLGIMNDMISSFRIDSDVVKASLYEHINYEGDVFEVVGGTNIPWLILYGWNDKASSMKIIE